MIESIGKKDKLKGKNRRDNKKDKNKKMETFDEKINLDEMVILKEDANFIFLGVDVGGKKCEYVVQKPQTVIYDHEEFENIFGTDVYEKIMTVREMEVNARKSSKD